MSLSPDISEFFVGEKGKAGNIGEIFPAKGLAVSGLSQRLLSCCNNVSGSHAVFLHQVIARG